MKRILFILSILAASSSMVLAADQAAISATTKMPTPKPMVTAPAAAPAVAAPEVTVVGQVHAVSLADAAKGTKSEITVVNEADQSTTLLVKSTTTLYDAAAKAISLENIMAGNNVSATYTMTKEGVNEAKTVKIIK